MRRTFLAGFTVIELMIVIFIIGILATIGVLGYGTWQRNVSDTSVKADLSQATSSLTTYKNFHNNYPPNLAGANFASSQAVALTLYTNAPYVGVYSGLSADQNAQLLLNTCNANLNETLNTVCTFNGSGNGAKIHVSGTVTSNTQWDSPICNVAGAGCGSVMQLTCGDACTAATNAIIDQFSAQGGTFPVTVTGTPTALPEPTQSPNGPATRFCLEGRSGKYSDIIYHTTNTAADSTAGSCPADPDLRYFSSTTPTP